jgi:hypothetical protein
MRQRLACLMGLVLAALFIPFAAEAASGRKGGTRPPSRITVVNSRDILLAGVEVSTEGAAPRVVARLGEGLAAGQTAKIRLAKPSGCSYTVHGTFEDGSETTVEGVNICADSTLRFTE